jgi:hypothetical protein
MTNKMTKDERTEIALKAVTTRRRNEKDKKRKNSARAKKAWETRKTISHETASYTNGEKKTIRNFLTLCMLSVLSPKVGEILTLPDEFLFEKIISKIKDLKNLTFRGFEIHRAGVKTEKQARADYKNQLRIIESTPSLRNRCLQLFKDINEYIMFEKREGSFAHILLDYCGSFTTNKRTITHVLENNLVMVGGIIWITLNARDKYDKNTNVNLFKLITKTGGNRYRFEKIDGIQPIYKYQGSDNRKGAPMYTVLLRRVK